MVKTQDLQQALQVLQGSQNCSYLTGYAAFGGAACLFFKKKISYHFSTLFCALKLKAASDGRLYLIRGAQRGDEKITE